MPGTFIDVEIDPGVAGDAELGRKLEEVCPVDIFKASERGVQIDEHNLDECVLCRLCLLAMEQEGAPDGAVRVIKLYEEDPAEAVLR
ncbi:MAG: hypothetical protein DLM59_06425 [Pseudonocardiales bacterium]|nr:MAG: hypothetical protein DLM59_06425 [Pseudonocardiales bacterium]